MAKTIVSAFNDSETAAQVLHSIVSSGFDQRLFSVVEPVREEAPAPSELPALHDVTSLQARLYRKELQMGHPLVVARVREGEVARLIKLLQSTGGRHIEAFDTVNSPPN